MSWTDIAQTFGVSISTMKRWRIEVDYQDPRPRLEGDELDDVVEHLMAGQAYRGEALGMNAVRALGYQVRRQDYRDSIHRVDPDGCEERKRIVSSVEFVIAQAPIMFIISTATTN